MLKGATVKRTFLAAILGAIILFIWSYITWTILPWHQGEMNLYKHLNPVTAGSSMWIPLISQFIVQYIAAWLVILMLLSTELKGYWCAVGFFILFGLAAGIICYLPHWIWYGIPPRYTVVNILDSVISWFLVGLVLGWLPKKT